MTYLGSLKGSAAGEVDESVRPHVGHCLEAQPRVWIDTRDGDDLDVLLRVSHDYAGPEPAYQDTFLILRCRDCDVDILELDE